MHSIRRKGGISGRISQFLDWLAEVARDKQPRDNRPCGDLFSPQDGKTSKYARIDAGIYQRITRNLATTHPPTVQIGFVSSPYRQSDKTTTTEEDASL